MIISDGELYYEYNNNIVILITGPGLRVLLSGLPVLSSPSFKQPW